MTEVQTQSQDRRARRLRLYRRGAGAAARCVIRASRSRCSPPTAAPGRRCARCFRSSRRSICRSSSSIEGIDWARRRPRSRVLRAAACDDAEGDQGPARQGADHQGGRSLRRLPSRRPGRLCALVRPRAPRARAAEGGGLRPDRGLPRRRSRTARLVANPGCYTTCAQLAARAAAARPRRSIPTRSSSTPSPA